MIITDLKDLERLFKLCRKQGIAKFSLGEIQFELGDLPTKPDKYEGQDLGHNDAEIPSDNPYANFPDGTLTNEQLAHYSSGGTPDNDPYLQDNVSSNLPTSGEN
jgi:hypothetical protein